MTLSHLYLYPDFVVMFSDSIAVETHAHHAMQISFGLEHAIELQFNALSVSGMGVFIASDIAHQLDSKGKPTINFLIHPESELGLSLRHNLYADELARVLALDLPLLDADWSALTCEGVLQMAKQVWSTLQIQRTLPFQLDPRIKTILQHIYTLADTKVSVQTLASLVHLSPSRFMYLFKENIGIPLRRYLLWRRLLLAFEHILSGMSFTMSAHEVGFSDSAHLSRTFKQMFGITLQAVFAEDSVLQSGICTQV